MPITSLKLTSGTDIFGFDGDGLCTYITCTWPNPYGYEGPGVSFNIISSTSGIVNFNPPIAANGGTAYFSLEESLTSATACTSVINNSVHKFIDQNGTRINAAFTSNTNLFYNLTQAATLCGFAGWDWQQTITSWPRQSSLFPIGSATPKSTPPPFLDPVPGGYTYNLPGGDHSYPFYLDPNNGEVQSNEPSGPTGFVLNFSDTPTEPCLPGGPGAPSCPTRAPAGSKLGFTTHLVGLVGSGPGWGVQDTGIGFSWTSTFNGTSGGVATTKNFKPVDPGSGTGGINNYNDGERRVVLPVSQELWSIRDKWQSCFLRFSGASATSRKSDCDYQHWTRLQPCHSDVQRDLDDHERKQQHHRRSTSSCFRFADSRCDTSECDQQLWRVAIHYHSWRG